LEREKFTQPLLIGGATTSKVHTAVKIAPAFSQPVVHVIDASRAAAVANSLISPQLKPAYAVQNRSEQAQARQDHLEHRGRKPLLSLAEARARKTPIDWTAADLPKPSFTGLRTIAELPLPELVPFIDWSPFFHVWELRGRYPAIFDDPVVGDKAREVFDDAQKLLDRIRREKLLTARGIYGFFPANSLGDDVEIYADESRTQVLTRFHFLRQQMDKPADQFNHCLADYIAPIQPSAIRNPQSVILQDYLGFFAVTTGHGVDELCRQFELDNDDYNSIMTKALADRLAEAFAEYLHKQARADWGYGRDEKLTAEDMIRERYRGIRPAPGYPACPDHTEKRLLFDLLEVEKETGIKLTESCAMHPASSVSGFYFAHPEAKYFAVGKIDRDQVLDYHRRKEMDIATVEQWLAPYLNY